MQTQCISEPLAFEGFGGRRVEAAFDGGAVTSDAGVLLLREADRVISLLERVAACFQDERDPGRVVHVLRTLIGQRIVAIALGYEDVVDHDELRFDPVLTLFSDRLQRRRPSCRDYRKFRVRAMTMGTKEASHGTTQTAGHFRSIAGPAFGWNGREGGLREDWNGREGGLREEWRAR